jgi:hypothetical protein
VTLTWLGKIDDELEIRSTNQKRGDEALAEPVTSMFLVAPEDKRTVRNSSPKLSLELGEGVELRRDGHYGLWLRA